MQRSLRSIVPVALVAIGCATTHASLTSYRQVTPKSGPADVQVFTDRPERPYEEIGMIEVNKTGLTGGYGMLIERARLEAAQMGADAIIVTRTPTKTTTTVANQTGRNRKGGRNTFATTTEHENPRITVSAIVWKGQP